MASTPLDAKENLLDARERRKLGARRALQVRGARRPSPRRGFRVGSASAGATGPGNCRFLADCPVHNDELIPDFRKGKTGLGCTGRNDDYRRRRCRILGWWLLVETLRNLLTRSNCPERIRSNKYSKSSGWHRRQVRSPVGVGRAPRSPGKARRSWCAWMHCQTWPGLVASGVRNVHACRATRNEKKGPERVTN